MGNIVYDTLDNELRTDIVVESIVNILNHKYGKEFQVLRIGERFGTDVNDEATVICTIKNYNNFLFKVVYNMVTGKIVEDNFFIRCTCYYVEKEINKLLNDVDSIVRVEINKKNSLNGIYKVEDFLEEYLNQKYVATLVVKNSNRKLNQVSQELLNRINEKYRGIKLAIISYEMKDEDFEKFIVNTRYMDHFSMEYIENYQYNEKHMAKIENGLLSEIDS